MLKLFFFAIGILLFKPAFPGKTPDEKTTLWNAGIRLIPYPQSVVLGGSVFVFDGIVMISVDRGASVEDLFSASELQSELLKQWRIESQLARKPEKPGIVLTRKNVPKLLGVNGYQIEASPKGLTVRASSAAGLFYGTQTLLQLIQTDNGRPFVKEMLIKDWPDIPIRAVHYDTKHFQEKKEYVFNFIRTLAGYKINMLIWEWEDKFAYKSHPEIGAPVLLQWRKCRNSRIMPENSISR